MDMTNSSTSAPSNTVSANAVSVELRDDGVAFMWMQRPERFNAFNEAMIADMDQTLHALGADPAVRVVVLCGRGQHFSAGADLQWMQRAAHADFDWNLADARRFAAMLDRLARTPKPTLARVQGAAFGGGVGLVCACDIAIASTDASFAISEAKFGILPAVIGPYVINAIGPRHARRLALTAERIDARAAASIGLVHEAVAPTDLDSAIEHTLHRLLQNGPQAQREIKQLLAQLAPGPIDASTRELTATTIARVRSTEEARAGFAAFLNKHAAPWVHAKSAGNKACPPPA